MPYAPSPFFEHVWRCAHAVFFFEGRLKLVRPGGTEGTTGKIGSALAAYSSEDADAIHRASLRGKFLPLVFRFSNELRTTWRGLVRFILRKCGGVASLEDLYGMISGHPKTAANPNWKAQVRQQVQKECRRVGPALWQQGFQLTA